MQVYKNKIYIFFEIFFVVGIMWQSDDKCCRYEQDYLENYTSVSKDTTKLKYYQYKKYIPMFCLLFTFKINTLI